MRKRTKAREYALQILYAIDITKDEPKDCIEHFWAGADEAAGEVKELANTLVLGVSDKKKEIDKIISEYATNWQLDRMAVIDRNVLRFSTYELLFMKDIPPKVSINEAKDIALGDINQVRKFAKDKDFVVVVRPKADIFMNGSMTEYDDYVRMGTRLPLARIDAGRVTVNVPVMDADGTLVVKKAYMNAEDVNIGFLPFTARNIYKQALMMLNQPYGWGDMYGEQDCSRFLQMVFATVGIMLPRDSKTQAQVGNSIVDFNGKSDDAAKIAAIVRVPAANTILAMKGHIMLYLGTVDGKPYVIHDTTVSAMNRVIISDLSLGQGTPKGSLLKRLTRTVTIE